MEIFSSILGDCEDLNLLCDVVAGESFIQVVLNVVFMFAGAVSIIFIILGGARYVISQGDPAKIKQAKDTILYALVGLVVSIFAVAIVGFVVGRIGSI